jgi:hypothetical protein
MSTDQIAAAILFFIAIVVPAAIFVMDDGKWQRKR